MSLYIGCCKVLSYSLAEPWSELDSSESLRLSLHSDPENSCRATFPIMYSQ